MSVKKIEKDVDVIESVVVGKEKKTFYMTSSGKKFSDKASAYRHEEMLKRNREIRKERDEFLDIFNKKIKRKDADYSVAELLLTDGYSYYYPKFQINDVAHRESSAQWFYCTLIEERQIIIQYFSM